MARPKRKANAGPLTVDGLEESANRASKTSRTAETTTPSNASLGQRFGETTEYIPLNQLPQVVGAEEEDAEATEVAQGSEDADDAATSNFVHYGSFKTTIVGVRYYRGRATRGEHVILRREPQNKYDRNAICVENVMRCQIGHIGRGVAAKLAKYMDPHEIVIEAVLTGTIGSFTCPIMLKLYGTADPDKAEELQMRLKVDGLLAHEIDVAERERKKQQQEQRRQQEAAATHARALALGQAAQGWQTNDDPTFSNLSAPEGTGKSEDSLEDLMDQSKVFNPREIGRVVETFGQKEDDLAKMPMADSPETLATTLLPYQRQGLKWMISRESPVFPAPGSDAIVQLWKHDKSSYLNIATNFSTTTEPPLASGGILADDMGLGKTLQTIALILANPTPRTPSSSKTTLIISPVGVMSNWRNQIQDHTRPETAPKVFIYHGTGKKEAKNLANYDVVITSYGALHMEFNPQANKPPAKGIFSLHWRRVVLDEGHTIRNPRSKASLAASGLRADSRWTLTGTPIINNLKDLYSQVRFLKLSGGLEDLGVFNSVLIRPLTSRDPEARLLLEALMATICLRRTKSMKFVDIRLPEMTSRILRVKFHDHEQKKYDALQQEAKGALLQFKDNQGSYSNLLEVLLRMRQVCNHWGLCKDRIETLMKTLEENKVVPLTTENVKALQDLLQLAIESQEICAICLDNLEEPVITACAHSFCSGCIKETIIRQHKCPLCRAEIKDESVLVFPVVDLGEDPSTAVADASKPSSKIEALMKVLTAKGQAENTKTVVFSQWTSFLTLIEPQLEQRSIKFARVDGSMQSIKRDNSINMFSNDPSCTVLLASLNVCSVGLNLVAGNQVILCDSWWAPAIEDQAIDRVYRLGQNRETTVWRLVMEDTIEERVIHVQERKRALMQAAFRETGRRKAEDRTQRVADLETLLE
ncbi:hypothetical protein N7532_006790 [Penicillium argentinense]|uniref:SNF2 family helicase n=1 Tax=Penicillium argentinense TaxID=1131581 RepID=A0A9W9FGN4_9EURO|nr:uncharacterized protein N7532_006790 [Penicillium argentinense]KAJ5099789.1 hypothetical protein N7532_006790 [Penicillium argentinense]